MKTCSELVELDLQSGTRPLAGAERALQHESEHGGGAAVQRLSA